ncbi:hypothetical protein, partial [Rhodothermus marinus]|uniref:hypothetical protein n=1 Tax=Rhodothermus marinus TaxID=29549 RepID=UPI000B0FBEA0
GYSLTFTPPPEGVPLRPLLLTETKVAVTPFREAFRLAGTAGAVGAGAVHPGPKGAGHLPGGRPLPTGPSVATHGAG